MTGNKIVRNNKTHKSYKQYGQILFKIGFLGFSCLNKSKMFGNVKLTSKLIHDPFVIATKTLQWSADQSFRI